jgi:hypothetical protein
MFGYFSNAVSFGQRPGVKQTITGNNLTSVVPGIAIWYDASITANVAPNTAVNGTTLTSLIDRGASKKNATGGGTPKYATAVAGSLGAANLASSAFFTTTGTTSSLSSKTGLSVIMVIKPRSLGSTVTLCGTDQNDLIIRYTGGVWKTILSGITASTTTAGTTNTWQIHSFVYDGSKSGNAQKLRYRYNKVDQLLTFSGTVPNQANASNDNYYWGAESGGVNALQGYIGEVILANLAISGDNVAAIETYLGAKWGI